MACWNPPPTNSHNVQETTRGQLDVASNTSVMETIAISGEETAATTDVSRKEPHLLGLPLEIRLQIYGWIHAAHPVQHAQLAPWYPNPIHSVYFLGPVNPPGVETEDLAVPGKIVTVIDGPAREDNYSNPDQKHEEPPLLSPNRPISGIPSALLGTNRQIYNECRSLPFHANEFVFVNWFSSGLWAARAFTRGLRPWQRDEMRWARLEMLGRDFTGPTLKEWIELCGHWTSGLRGLRLKILIGGGIFEPTAPFAALNNNAEAQAMGLGSITTRPDPRPEWVEEGLRKLEALRRLEVELSVLDWGDGEKVEWCTELGKMLNVGREGKEGIVVVRCVEKLEEDRGPKRQVCEGIAKN